MNKYRKKSAVIEAVQLLPGGPVPDGVILWPENGVQPRDTSLGYVNTPKGRTHVCSGDWIITSNGERYLCSPDIFEATYEKVEP